MSDANGVFGINPLSFFKDPKLGQLFQYWQRLRRGGRFPSRDQIVTEDLRSLISNVWICDYVPELKTFRYRVAGDDLAKAVGQDICGLLLSDFSKEDQFETINAHLCRAISEPSIFYMSGAVHQPVGRAFRGERLGLPIQDPDSDHVDGLLGITVADLLPMREQQAKTEESNTVFLPIEELADA